MDALRCAHVIASLNDASAGPTYSVSALVCALVDQGCDCSLLTLQGWRGDAVPPDVSGAPIHSFARREPSRLPIGRSPAMRDELERRASTTEIFHTHGLWLMPNVYPSQAARRGTAKVVISPRGMLGAEALRFSAWKKRLFMRAFQRDALSRADCIHATAQSELEEVRAHGFRNPVAVIPNGIDLPHLPSRLGRGAQRTLLSLGRLHPKKGLSGLAAAWVALEPAFPDWRLRIVGPDEQGYASEIRQILAAGGATRATVEPPVHGEAKTELMAGADLFVLPSLNENFAMTVAEALAHGVPVVSTKGAPWAGLETHGCGWWIDHGTETLRATLADAMQLSQADLSVMGIRGREWMAREFSWRHVAEQMAAVYRWLARDEPRPACVAMS